MSNAIKIFITSSAIHCHRRNLDHSRLIKYFKLNDCDIVKNPKDANYIIVVTCGYNKNEEEYAFKLISKLNKYNKELVIVGCLPGVASVRLGKLVGKKSIVTKELNRINSIFGNFKIKFSDIPDANFHHSPSIFTLPFFFFRQTLSVRRFFRQFEFSKHFFNKCSLYIKQEFAKKSKDYISRSYVCANLRISQGCLGNCAYCSIRDAIGTLKSKALEICLKEYEELLDKGYREFSIIADDVGAYGIEINSSFAELLEKMSRIDKNLNTKWYILELHPYWAIKYKSELLKEIKDGKIEHILIPFQSGSRRILELMNRYNDIEKIKTTIAEFKKVNHHLSISSHFIIGFPSETNDDFLATLNFIREVNIDQPFFFPYSDREGTIAYEMENKIDIKTIDQRMKLL